MEDTFELFIRTETRNYPFLPLTRQILNFVLFQDINFDTELSADKNIEHTHRNGVIQRGYISANLFMLHETSSYVTS